ncbi:MAG: zinc ribbon domain-containing protein, partial [Saccharolobus sp.]
MAVRFLIFNALSIISLMMGDAQRKGWKPRILSCSKCGFSYDRDVIGAWNIALKLDVSLMLLGSNVVHDPCVEWLVITMNGKVEAQVLGYEKKI